MMKEIFILILIITFVNCPKTQTVESETQVSNFKISVQNNSKNFEEYGIQLTEDQHVTYSYLKRKISQIRQELSQKNLSQDSISKIFTQLLLNEIIPFWYGTEWSFEGHTSVPKKGTIACGYFVSTTLRDMGLILNYYKLAQQNPINEAKSLALNTKIIEIQNPEAKANIAALQNSLKEGIAFIGFDQSHVGYILKGENQLFLIHSNFIDNQGVIIEKIEESEVFKYFERFYIAEISHNPLLLKSWLDQSEIKIITE